MFAARRTVPPLFATLMLCAAKAVAAEPPARDPSEPPPGLTWLPGHARAIPRTGSASRDTPLVEYAVGPKAQGSVGTELGVFAQRWPDLSVRLGLYAMVALENETEDIIFPRETWRGLFGFSFSTSFDALARSWLGPRSKLELTLLFGHESDHRTDRPLELDALDYAALGQVNFVSHDLAIELPLGEVGRFQGRLQERNFVGSAWSHAPGVDLQLRLHATEWLHPVLSVFAEAIVSGDDEVQTCPFARALAGAAFVGRFGELTPFASFDAGCRKGLLFEERGSRFSAGFRYAPF